METIKLKLLGQTVSAETLSQQLTAIEAIEYMKLKFTDIFGPQEDIYVREVLRGHIDANQVLDDGSSPLYTIYEVYADSGSTDYLTFAHLSDYTI